MGLIPLNSFQALLADSPISALDLKTSTKPAAANNEQTKNHQLVIRNMCSCVCGGLLLLLLLLGYNYCSPMAV